MSVRFCLDIGHGHGVYLCISLHIVCILAKVLEARWGESMCITCGSICRGMPERVNFESGRQWCAGSVCEKCVKVCAVNGVTCKAITEMCPNCERESNTFGIEFWFSDKNYNLTAYVLCFFKCERSGSCLAWLLYKSHYRWTRIWIWTFVSYTTEAEYLTSLTSHICVRRCNYEASDSYSCPGYHNC